MSKEIPLTQGKVAIVDDEDYERLNRHKWYAHKRHAIWYAIRTVYKDGKKMVIRMHREILKPSAKMETDHKDGNGLNNQRHNLRVATHTENQHNRRKRKGTSRFKGVCFNRHAAKWEVRITVEGKRLHLGLFVSEMDAAKVYDKVARKYFGEFAQTNFQNPKEYVL